MIYANTTSVHPTHFISAVPLICEARKKFKVASENWPYPTRFRFGSTKDLYYAEIWQDGMDWQNTYWIIESIKFSEPMIVPLIKFSDHSEEDKFNSVDFLNMMNAIFYYRRDSEWIKHGDLGVYNDTVWPFVERDKRKSTKVCGTEFLVFCSMQHASQEKVIFEINRKFLPDSNYYGKKF